MTTAPTAQLDSRRAASQTTACEWRPGQPLPHGWYIDPKEPDDPRLRFKAAAAFLECGEHVIRDLESKGKLSSRQCRRNPGSCGVGDRSDFVIGFPLSQLRQARDERAGRAVALGGGRYQAGDEVRVNLKRAAKTSGVPFNALVRETRKIDKKRRSNFLRDLGINIKEITFAGAKGGTFKAKTLLEEDAARLGRLVKLSLKEGRPKGFGFTEDIGRQLGLSGAQFIELRTCLQCWRINGQLPARPVFRWQPGKIAPRGHGLITVQRLRWSWSFDITKALSLWSEECSAKAGASILRKLLKGGSLPAAQVKEEMARRGFVGPRLNAARRMARVDYRLSNGAGSDWMYELRSGEPRQPARKVLKSILQDGPVTVTEGRELLREAGWSVDAREVRDAMKGLGIRTLHPEGVGRGMREEGRRLAHGPYEMPRCQIGDRLVCKVKGEVVVGGFHRAGETSWPYIRQRGMHQLVFCGDLERAVRQESVAAVAHWLGISGQPVRRWREALGVPTCPQDAPRYWCLPGQTPPRPAEGQQTAMSPDPAPAATADTANAAENPEESAGPESQDRIKASTRGRRPDPEVKERDKRMVRDWLADRQKAEGERAYPHVTDLARAWEVDPSYARKVLKKALCRRARN
jgi:hypothetical protein